MYVERATAELARRGHRVVIVAPSRSHDAVRETRQALRAAIDNPEQLLPEPGLRLGCSLSAMRCRICQVRAGACRPSRSTCPGRSRIY